MYKVGKLDIKKYICVTEDIVTDEVVITSNQIEHIKERHPNDFERFSKYFPQIIESPDYILEANKPNTAFVLKEFRENGEHFQLILRLKTSTDPAEYSNSIITFLRVRQKEWNRLINNKNILYKSE